MAGRIRKSDIDEVRSRINIADVVGDYVALKPAGIGSLKGLCPFHDERNPSFHVRPQVGLYHCFGCGEGGDVYSFLQKIDHLTFAEAVERLAAKVGVGLHYEDGGQAADQGNRVRLLAANRAAAEFFADHLTGAEAEPGQRFLKERGFDRVAAEAFGVGFAPKSWDELTRQLRAKGFTDTELLAAGLVSRGDRGVYDRFRGRLVWPIRDLTGDTVGFGARRLLDSDQGPKYLNTPETPIYHKSQVLYGLDLAKRDIARSRQVVVVEGYTDVMACVLAGVPTAVATCGTSFGVEHIKVLRRVLGDDSSGLGEVVFTFDPDAAGHKAAVRAFAEEQRFAAQTFVAVGPDGLDPCDLRVQRGDDAVRRLLSTKKPMFEFMIRQVLAAHNLDTVEGRVAALRSAARLVADIRDRSLRPGYTRELAGWLGLELGEVRAAVAASEQDAARTPTAAPHTPRDPENTPAAAPRPRSVSLQELPTDPGTRLERDALMAVLQLPHAVGRELIERAARSGFVNNSLAVVRDAIATSLDFVDAPDWLARITGEVPQPYASLVEQLGVAPLPSAQEAELGAYARAVTSALVDRDLLRRKAELLGQLQRTDATVDPQRYRALQTRLVTLERDRRVLRG